MKITSFMLIILVFSIISCNEKQVYEGSWEAVSGIRETKIKLHNDTLSILGSNEEYTDYPFQLVDFYVIQTVPVYKLHSTYGKDYFIEFPVKDNYNIGQITNEAGGIHYFIYKSEYYTQEEAIEIYNNAIFTY
ncbi:hypothetical protein NBRC110019_31840 [Neptunitalea chrysea]|uniref:Uncharacterized protein n=1 Tax=Neptunitalea chrysea TaxID=1647581 RepID=A0A9W6EX09_9FLAO|nr:hypothetical protein [Neptunitalea chrysea]GLB54143.1 hypothetical protein NBRC110019_31840 [Neptunitalea chrysea]